MFFKKARIIEFTYIWLQTNGSICRPRCVIKCLQNCVCVCWFGIILSCLDNIGQFAQVIGETVGFGQIVHHDSRISFMSILGCCVTTVSEVSLCVAVWSLSFKKIIYLASRSLTQVCCQYLGVPRHRT